MPLESLHMYTPGGQRTTVRNLLSPPPRVSGIKIRLSGLHSKPLPSGWPCIQFVGALSYVLSYTVRKLTNYSFNVPVKGIIANARYAQLYWFLFCFVLKR